ncbi:hypothetical protein [Nocardioides hungaricus]
MLVVRDLLALPSERPTVTRSLTARRTLAAAALAPLLASGLVACGSDSGGDAASEPTSQAAAAADLQEGDEVAPADFVQTVTDGLEASTTATMSMKMSAGSAGEMTADGQIDYTKSPPEVAMTMTSPLGGGDMEVRMVGGIMYLSLGQMTEGKFWRIDPADPNSPLGQMGLGSMLDQFDPAKMLTSMQDGISQVVYAGQQDGLDQYDLTIDMKQMLDSMGGDLPKGAESQLPATMTYSLWLDDQGRFSKMSMDEMPMGGMSGSMEMTVSGWGEDVTIEAPPADQVTKMPDLEKMMQGMTSGSGSA